MGASLTKTLARLAALPPAFTGRVPHGVIGKKEAARLTRMPLIDGKESGLSALGSDREYEVAVHEREVPTGKLDAHGNAVTVTRRSFQFKNPVFDVPVKGRGFFFRARGAGGLRGRIAYSAVWSP
jgi:hypothetical protein